MKKPKLIMMVGISGSGKSKIAEEISQQINAIILSADIMREELLGDIHNQTQNKEIFDELYKKAVELIKDNKNVIIDATNIKSVNRINGLKYFDGIPCEKIAYIVATPFNKCLEKNGEDNKVIKESVLKNQISKFEIPYQNEGFDLILIESTSEEKGKSIDNIIEEMKGFNQKSRYKKYNLDIHSIKLSNKLKKCDAPKSMVIGALLHDYGKLFTQRIDDKGEAHYYNHENIGTYKLLTEMDFSEFTLGERLDILFLINYHMIPYFKSKDKVIEIFGEKQANTLIGFNNLEKQMRRRYKYDKSKKES